MFTLQGAASDSVPTSSLDLGTHNQTYTIVCPTLQIIAQQSHMADTLGLDFGPHTAQAANQKRCGTSPKHSQKHIRQSMQHLLLCTLHALAAPSAAFLII